VDARPQWEQWTHDLERVLEAVQDIAGIISSIKTGFRQRGGGLGFFGLLSAPPDQFALLTQHIDGLANGLSGRKIPES